MLRGGGWVSLDSVRAAAAISGGVTKIDPLTRLPPSLPCDRLRRGPAAGADLIAHAPLAGLAMPAVALERCGRCGVKVGCGCGCECCDSDWPWELRRAGCCRCGSVAAALRGLLRQRSEVMPLSCNTDDSRQGAASV